MDFGTWSFETAEKPNTSSPVASATPPSSLKRKRTEDEDKQTPSKKCCPSLATEVASIPTTEINTVSLPSTSLKRKRAEDDEGGQTPRKRTVTCPASSETFVNSVPIPPSSSPKRKRAEDENKQSPSKRSCYATSTARTAGSITVASLLSGNVESTEKGEQTPRKQAIAATVAATSVETRPTFNSVNSVTLPPYSLKRGKTGEEEHEQTSGKRSTVSLTSTETIQNSDGYTAPWFANGTNADDTNYQRSPGASLATSETTVSIPPSTRCNSTTPASRENRMWINHNASTYANRAPRARRHLPPSSGKQRSEEANASQGPEPQVKKPFQRSLRAKSGAPKFPVDIWENIFTHCPSPFLVKARMVCKQFNEIISYDCVWKWRREKCNPPGMPGPFEGMSEKRFAYLLDGVGCMSCRDSKARKTYWAWQKRWCQTCLRRQTERDLLNKLHARCLFLLLDEKQEIVEHCLPYSLLDHRGQYLSAGSYERENARLTRRTIRIYRSVDVEEMIKELRAIEGPEGKADDLIRSEVMTWIAQRKQQVQPTFQHAQQIEKFTDDAARYQSRHKNSDIRYRRYTFFLDRCELLDPPVDDDLASEMDCFQNSVRILREPTERCWKALKPKVLASIEKTKQKIVMNRNYYYLGMSDWMI